MGELLMEECLVGVIYLCLLYEIVDLIQERILSKPPTERGSATERSSSKNHQVRIENKFASGKRFPSRNFLQMRMLRD